MSETTDIEHYQLSFISRSENFTCLPDYSIAVPAEANAEKLNAIVNKILESVQGDAYKPVCFEFLISSSLLRDTLKELVVEYGIPTETVIPVECILREPAPVPESDISLSDWVGAVRTHGDHIYAASYNGSISSCTLFEGHPENKTLHTGAAKCLQVLPNASGRKVLSGGHDQVIILSEVQEEATSGRLTSLAVFCGHERSVECIAVNEDGSRFVSGSFDSYLKLWTTDLDDEATNYKGKEQTSVKKRRVGITKTPVSTLAGHKDAIVGVSWLPESKKDVATVSWDRNMVFWDLDLAGQTGMMPAAKSFTCLSVCPRSGMIITGSVDPIVRLWDPRSKEGSLVKKSFIGHTGWVSSLCWRPDSDHIFISASFDKTLRMWDIRSEKTSLYNLKGHSDRVLCCDWSNKDYIVSGGADNTVKVFKSRL